VAEWFKAAVLKFTSVRLGTIYRGIIPFVIIYLIALGLIAYVPDISLIGVRILLAKG
jgi:C4-dicarboxylate transporter DctM subunit